MRKIQIGVMGPSKTRYPEDKELNNKVEEYAEEIGAILAKRGVIVMTGGCDGVMEAAMRGAKKEGGLTIGFPGRKRKTVNQYCDVEVLLDVEVGSFAVSGMLSCDALITIPAKSAGTLAEIALAYRHKIPNVVLTGFDDIYDSHYIEKYLDSGKSILLFGAKNPQEAVERALDLATKRLQNH